MLAHLLPPAFVLILSVTIWCIYVFLHAVPMLQSGVPPAHVDVATMRRGYIELGISQFFTLMYVVCYIRSVFTKPGSVPNDVEWSLGFAAEDASTQRTFELKLTGERRHCKWCKKYKPDRCHHCRICKACVLKMDHHCPWIMNCVGHGNHKFFFLLVIYSALDCFFIGCTVVESVWRTVIIETPSENRFLLVLCLVLSVIVFFLTGLFLSFHTWLMFKGMTTIEFCEKGLPEVGVVSGAKGRSAHDHGVWNNFTSVFGSNPLLWWLPIATLRGNGVHFPLIKTMALGGDGVDGDGDKDPEWTGGGSNALSRRRMDKLAQQ